MDVDIVIATYNRAAVLRETLHNVFTYCTGFKIIYVIDNASTDNTQKVLSQFESEQLVVIKNETNIGAAMGKNVGLRRSESDIVVVIDDDAVFNSNDPIAKVKQVFFENYDLGIIQFKITNFQTKKVLKYEFPGQNIESQQNEEFDIGYFIGAGHAIRKSVLNEVGYYPEEFGLYAHEEVDLSYRVINHGYIMKYFPSVEVLHKKDPGGRMTKNDVLGQLLLNRMIMNRKYLPLYYLMFNNFVWTIKIAVDSKSLSLVFRIFYQYFIRRSSIPATKLSNQAITYLKKTGGRLYK